MADRSVSVLITLSDIERRDARSHIFQADLLNNSRTVWSGSRTHVWRGTFLWWQAHTPSARRAVPQCCPILGVPFYFCVHPLTQNYQIWCGSGLFSGGQPYPNEGGSPALPNFGGSLIRMRTHFVVEHQIWRGNTYRKWVCFQEVNHDPAQNGRIELQRSPIFRIFYPWLHSKEERPN